MEVGGGGAFSAASTKRAIWNQLISRLFTFKYIMFSDLTTEIAIYMENHDDTRINLTINL